MEKKNEKNVFSKKKLGFFFENPIIQNIIENRRIFVKITQKNEVSDWASVSAARGHSGTGISSPSRAHKADEISKWPK